MVVWTISLKLSRERPFYLVMNTNNQAVIKIIQHNTSTIGANNTSPFTVRLLNPDDYTPLEDLPGLLMKEWERPSEDGAVEVAVEIGRILTQERVPYRVEWA